jgi:phenylpropionate dioxygenase-like ring-hydroxylating dioxygenase large terminal subunit
MLSTQENEQISQVGPGTPAGKLMREYWLPMATSDELVADGDPVRVRLLGENLIAFRTTSGRVGLVDQFCPHRGTSLFFGRNEEEGIRCTYHGWKYDVSGECLEMPAEPVENKFKDKITLTAYPCVDRSGIVWTYMGPRATPPALPLIEANMGEGVSDVNRTLRYCNWLQALEGDIDTAHSEYLHAPAVIDVASMKPGTGMYYRHRLREIFKYEVRDTEFGTSYGANRPAEEGTTYWRIAHFLFPCFTMTPTPAAGSAQTIRMWIPVDDDHVLFWSIEASQSERDRRGHEYQEDTSDWMGRYRPVQNIANDYQIDRTDQKTETFTGIGGGFIMHDTMATESMGPTMDRSREHLGASDAMIIRTRKRIIDAVHAMQDGDVPPPGVDEPEVYGTRSGWMILPEGADWWEASAELRTAFVAKRDESEAVAALRGTK